MPPELIHVVVNGRAVRFLLETSPESGEIADMAGAGVEVSACSNSLERFGHSPEALTDGVETVDSGVAEVVREQQRGHTYLKLP